VPNIQVKRNKKLNKPHKFETNIIVKQVHNNSHCSIKKMKILIKDEDPFL
jgi:hypothetical protein